MKSFLILVILFFQSDIIFAQAPNVSNEIGYYFDINDNFIQGYLERDYNPKKKITIKSVLGDDFSTGYYYDSTGEKIVGWIKYSSRNTSFNFKKETENKSEVIKPIACKSYVIGLDSFIVIKDFDISSMFGEFHSKKEAFAEVVDQVGNLTFYKHVQVSNSNVNITFLVKADTTTKLVSFSNNIEMFSKIAPEYFTAFEPLKNKIQNKEYTSEDLPVLIKLLKYKIFFDNGTRIFYNQSWDEINDSINFNYCAKIISVKDTIFELKYFDKNGLPIRKGNYYSFYPNKKHGEFEWYYTNGSIRKKTNFIKNKEQTITTFFKNSNIHYQYKNNKDDLFFEKVFSKEGVEILNQEGSGVETFYDSLAGRNIIIQFEKNQLKRSYYIQDGEKIYLLCDKNAKLKITSMLISDTTTYNYYPVKSIKKYNHGFVLFKCLINSDGGLSRTELIKSLDSDCDSAAINYLISLNIRLFWKPGEVDDKKVTQELILPIEFQIGSFSWYRNNNYFYEPFIFNQIMFQNTIPPLSLPSGVRF